MKKQSAGILLYRRNGKKVEVLLGHAGGPFWGKKDKGAWSIPKGETEPDEDLLTAAKREFAEEMGMPAPTGEYVELASFKRKDGKQIYVWAVEGDLDATKAKSNMFEMEWPPKSGQIQQYPEIDKAAWFDLQKAGPKLHKGQDTFLVQLAEKLGVNETAEPKPDKPDKPAQTSLF